MRFLRQWNRNADGDRIIWCHAQNLNERAHEPDGPMWRNGRAWLHFPGVGQRDGCFGVEWVLWRPKDWSFSLKFALNETFGEDYDLCWHLKVPVLGALYWNATGLFSPALKRRLPEGRELSFRVYEEYVWVSLWAMDPAEHWGKDENRFRWQRLTWDWKQTLMGRLEYRLEQIGEPQQIVIPMPERNYPATMQIERQTWWRTRWPWRKVRISADIDLGRGIPVPGKGENSWDCGEDAICGMGSGPSVAEAVSTVVKRVLETRERYGGSDWQPRERANVR